MALKFNPGVSVDSWNRHLHDAFEVASEWSLRTGHDLYLTSLSRDDANSLHSYNLAVDFGVAGNETVLLDTLASWLKNHLPAGWQVVFGDAQHQDHVHVEWDVR